MNTKLVVLRNGEPLFESPIELDADVGLAVGATMALSEFHRLNPTISLLDPEISIRFKNSSELHYPAPTPAIRGSVAANSLFLQFGLCTACLTRKNLRARRFDGARRIGLQCIVPAAVLLTGFLDLF